jgi:hypothetical protein
MPVNYRARCGGSTYLLSEKPRPECSLDETGTSMMVGRFGLNLDKLVRRAADRAEMAMTMRKVTEVHQACRMKKMRTRQKHQIVWTELLKADRALLIIKVALLGIDLYRLELLIRQRGRRSFNETQLLSEGQFLDVFFAFGGNRI